LAWRGQAAAEIDITSGETDISTPDPDPRTLLAITAVPVSITLRKSVVEI
jgi:hypothetical protein